jgi:hypothetical protein
MKSDVMAATPKQKKQPKVLEHIRVSEAENGGHVLEHHHTSYDHPPETHVFGADEGTKLVAHLAKHAHIKLDKEAAAGTEENESKKEKEQL